MIVYYYPLFLLIEFQEKKMPTALMFEKLWGQLFQVTFIKKSVRGYLSKYFAKEAIVH